MSKSNRNYRYISMTQEIMHTALGAVKAVVQAIAATTETGPRTRQNKKRGK